MKVNNWNVCLRCEQRVDIRGIFSEGTRVSCACGVKLVTRFTDGAWRLKEPFSPSQVKAFLPEGGIGKDGQVDHAAFVGMFGRLEAEWVAGAVCHALASADDRWRPLDVEEVLPLIGRSDLVRAGIVDPLIGRKTLEDAFYLVTDHAARTITPTQRFVDRLAERFA